MHFGLIYELALPIDVEESGKTEHQVYTEALEQISFAEEMGFDYVWLVEHHFLEDLSRSSSPEVFLAAVAQRTKTMRIGHGVVLTPPPFNHPVRVAERIATLDLVSDGRVEFGTGRSITVEELGGFGIDPEDSRGMWDEAVKLIPKLWRDRKFPGYEGRYVSFPPRVVVPKPLQKPHPPMWLACTSPSSFETAGRYGLGCLSFTTGGPSELRPLIDSYRNAIRDPQPISDVVNEQVATFTALYCGPDQQAAVERGGPAAVRHMARITRYFGAIAQHKGYSEYAKGFEERAQFAHDEVDPLERANDLIAQSRLCIGDPDGCAQVIENLRDGLGIDQFLGVVQYSDLSHEEVMRTIELMGTQVIPRFAPAASLIG